MSTEQTNVNISIPDYAVKLAAEDIAKKWDKAFDPDDPPCPPQDVIEHAVVRWISATVGDLIEDADWFARNSDHPDGKRLLWAINVELKKAEAEAAFPNNKEQAR